jgi:co-chaperonin GroES (HSP10)
MVLVERIQPPESTDSGLFTGSEEQPRLHIGRVLSKGPGEESESGLVLPMPDIEVGETVVLKNPWGIGPKDEETPDGRKLSYARSQDIAGVVRGGEVID